MKKFILSLFAAFFCMSLSAQVSLSDLVNADTESAIAKYLKAKAVSTGEAGVDNFCAAVRTAATASQQSNRATSPSKRSMRNFLPAALEPKKPTACLKV